METFNFKDWIYTILVIVIIILLFMLFDHFFGYSPVTEFPEDYLPDYGNPLLGN